MQIIYIYNYTTWFRDEITKHTQLYNYKSTEFVHGLKYNCYLQSPLTIITATDITAFKTLTLFYSQLDVCWLATSEPVKVDDAAIPRQPVASDLTETDNLLTSQSSSACYLSVNVDAVLSRYYWVLRLHCLMPGGKELALQL